MNYRRIAFHLRFLIFLLALPCPLLRAQDDTQQQEPPPIEQSSPKPAAHSPFPVIDPNVQGENQDQEAMQPDQTPLTGLQNATLGTPGVRHSYWVPGLQFGSTVQSAPLNGSGSSGWFAYNFFLGNVSLLKAWSRSELAVNYSGGGFFSTDNSTQTVGNTPTSGGYQQLAFAQTFHANRWLFQILDRFSYLPESEFGFGIGTNLGVAGVGGSLGTTVAGLSNSIVPNQSIFSGIGPVYSNTGVLQATYAISPRSSVTMAGSYGILRFVDPGNFDQDTVLGSLGYNYALSPKDAVGVVYRFIAYHYQGLDQAFGDHYVALAYSRKITGRLALQLYGGPEITNYRVPIGTDSQQVGFNTSANLNYATRGGSLGAAYTHGLSGGSGVLVGSTLDQVTVTANRALGRIWNGNVNFGYAHNSGLNGSIQSTQTPQSNSSSYDSWFGGAGLNRPIGRFASFGLSYTAYISKNSLSGCTGPNCSTSYTTNTINISVQWHTRPFVLE
jgi:hypothetical protein